MTQKEKIIKALKRARNKGMSDFEMAMTLGIGRPSARISELKKLGYTFDIKVARSTNILGEKTTFYKYILAGEPNVRG